MADAQRGARAAIEACRKEDGYSGLETMEKNWGRWKVIEVAVIFPADWNLITAQSGGVYFNPLRQAKYSAGAAIELLDEADRLGREHEKYMPILLQASEIVHKAHHELFWNENLFAQPFIEKQALRRNSVKAAEKRHENTELMRRNALKLRDAGKWSSRRQAAKAIVPEVQLHAKELGARVVGQFAVDSNKPCY